MATSYYVKVHLPTETTTLQRDLLAQVLLKAAALFSFQGMTDWSVDLAKHQKVLGVEKEFHDLTVMGKQKPEIDVYFAKKTDAVKYSQLVSKSFGDLRVAPARKLANKDWMKSWRKHYKPFRVRAGKRSLVVLPAWRKAPRTGVSVRIYPGQAFGTGTHPTTKLCLELMLGLEGAKKVLDFGAGTGILAIAARKIFPEVVSARAVESDPVALKQCKKNIGVNRARVQATAKIGGGGKYDLVLANVLSPVLLEYSRTLGNALAPSGKIILSGILAKEAEDFVRKFMAGQRLELVEIRREKDWCAILLEKK